MADSTLVNDNFEYLDNRITTVNSNIYSNNARFESDLATLSASLSASISELKAISVPIGQPILRLDNTLFDDEIRLEGATVSRTTYAALFAKYGTTYGEGDGSTTFKLPDFRGRVPWGATSFGYQTAGVPNITGTINRIPVNEDRRITTSGAFKPTVEYLNGASGNQSDWLCEGDGTSNQYLVNFNASESNSIYGAEQTVVPPGLKVRWVTRFE